MKQILGSMAVGLGVRDLGFWGLGLGFRVLGLGASGCVWLYLEVHG